MVLLDRLLEQYDLDESALFTRGGARVSGLNAGKVKSIVSRIAPGIPFECTSIGGRTSPGPATAAKSLLNGIRSLRLSAEGSPAVLEYCLKFCLSQVLALQGQQKIVFDFDASKPLQYAFTILLEKHAADVKGRALTQHLVGAKLELRFSDNGDIRIDRSSVDSRDVNKKGDFEVNDFAFHVTVNPNLAHAEKCQRNVQRDGKRPVILVPSNKTDAARTLADTQPDGVRIDVKSLEAFLSQNIEELAKFSLALLERKLVELFSKYNERVREAEPGKPYLEIEWPGLNNET
jgi:hypothetical protein